MKVDIGLKKCVLLSAMFLFFALSLIFCHSSMAEVTWQREDGVILNGEYASGAYFGGLQNARPVFVDIDADGDFDMFIGEVGYGINFYRNDGTPTLPSWTFITRTYGDMWSSGHLLRPAFCDIDNDGDYDMFIGGYESIAFCRNDGTPQEPSWNCVSANYVSRTINESSPVFCDIDADGDYDLFLGEWSGNILFYRNDGSAISPSWNLITENYNLIDVGYDSYPTFCDIDSDNDYDMFVSGSESNVYFYRNDGTPNSAVWTLVDSNYNYIGDESSATAFCDIDNDGDYDMFAGKRDGDIVFYENSGTSTSPSWLLMAKNYINWIDAGKDSIPALCDIDNDGDYDMFIGEENGNITFYRNDGTPNIPQWKFLTDNYNSINLTGNAPIFCDIDKDGDYDMFIGGENGNICFYRNDGTPEIPFWAFVTDNYNSVNVGWYSAPFFCDIDNDGDYDMFVGSYGGIYYYRNDGTPEVPTWVFITNSYADHTGWPKTRPIFCDMDLDGDYDLLVGGRAIGQLVFYQNDGTAENPVWTHITNSYNNIGLIEDHAPAICDIDNDGDYDMFIGEYNGGINFWRNMTVDHLKDEDFDTLPDYWEIKYWGNITTAYYPYTDYDGDKMFEIDEYTYGTDPTDPSDYVDIPPRPVTDFAAEGSMGGIFISWTDSIDLDQAGTVIVRKEGEYPQNIDDGVEIFNGADSSCYDADVLPDITYYYAAFAYDENFQYSQPAYTSQVFPAFLENFWQREYGTTVNGKYLSGAYSGGLDSYSPALVDIDGDGDKDLFIGNTSGHITFLRNDGTPTNLLWTLITDTYNSIDVKSPSAPAFCDIDADGDYDMFIGSSGSGICFYRNDGTPNSPTWKFISKNYVSIDPGTSTSDLKPTFCDIDADGDYDLFIGNSYGYILFYRNDGTEAVPSWTFITSTYNSNAAAGNNTAPVFCDIDSDGDYDMFVGEYNGNINFYQNNGTPNEPSWTLVTEHFYSIDIGDYSVPTFSDIDSDGDYDLFVGGYDKGINYYRNDGLPTSPAFVFSNGDFGMMDIGRLSKPTFCDIDADGDYDMFLVAGTIWFYRNDGTSASPLWTFVTSDYIHMDAIESDMAFCDIDNDGDYDLFIDDYFSGIYFYRNDGTPTNANWTFVTANYNSIRTPGPGAVTFCDIDADNDYDMFIGGCYYTYGTWSTYFYRNDGTPESPSWTFVTGYYIDRDIVDARLAFCDIDLDGDYDLFIGEGSQPYTDDDIYFYRNDGTPNSPSWTFVTTKYNSINIGEITAPAFCDIDGDGDYDMFVGEKYGGINFWRNTTIVNTAPIVTIASILPSPAYKEDTVNFVGEAIDSDENDIVVAYKWISNIDGQLSTKESFSTTTLSVGTHTITFEAQDSRGLWSEPTTATLEVKLNTPPTVSITSILPSPAYKGDNVTFTGIATDSDTTDTVVAHNWTSNLDGLLSEKVSFVTSALSLGMHTITFKAQDSHGAWSEPVNAMLEVKPPYELSLKDGQAVTGNVNVTMTYRGNPLSWFYFNVDGQYTRYNPWMTQYFSNGTHTVYGQYYDWQKREWYKTDPITVNVYNNTSYAPEIISPTDGSEISGNATIAFRAEGPRPYFATIYANDKVIGWKYLYGNSSPFNFAWQTTTVPNGQYSLKVVVYYLYAGYVVSKPVNVTVSNPVPPTLNITCPNPASGIVNVSISSNDNSSFTLPILYVDGRFIGYRLRLPCSIAWDTRKFTNGTHVLRVQAYHVLLRKWIVADKTIQVQN